MTAAPGESNYIIGGIVEDKGAEGRNVNQWHWTEKDITPWAKQHTAHLLTNLVIADQPTLHIATTDLRSFEGEVTLNVRKKKLIPLYELKFAVGWEAKQLDDQGTEMFRAEGQIEVPYLSEENHDEDPELRTTCTAAGVQAESLRQALLSNGKATLLARLATLVSDIRAGGPERAEAASDTAAATASSTEFKKQTAAAAKAAPPLSSSATASHTSLTLRESFRTSPEELYACFTNLARVLAFTQAPAVVEPEVGGTLSLYAGAVQCTYVELVPGARIILDWRFNTWPEGLASRVVMEIEARDAGETVLHVRQTGIPEQDKYGNEDVLSNVQQGWRQQIFYRIKAVFGYGV